MFVVHLNIIVENSVRRSVHVDDNRFLEIVEGELL